jgi:hypothetical protein
MSDAQGGAKRIAPAAAAPAVQPVPRHVDSVHLEALKLAVQSVGALSGQGIDEIILRRAREFASFLVDTELVAVSGDNPPVTG